jgi:hypothetical protein
MTARSLEAEIGLVLEGYENLNELHKRGDVEQQLARGAFIGVFSFLKQFVDALCRQGKIIKRC